MISSADILNTRVLAVDDLEVNVPLLEPMLRGVGYAAITSDSVAGRVQVTDATRQRRGKPFLLEERGIIKAKGIGELPTWFLAGRSNALSECSPGC